MLVVHKIEQRRELQTVEDEVNEKYGHKIKEMDCGRAAIISLLLMPPICQLPDVCLL